MASAADRIERNVVPGLILALSRVRAPAKLAARARRLARRRGTVEAWIAFDDPNSAVALVELERRTRGRDVDLVVHAVVARDIEGDPAVEAKRIHAVEDASRLALRYGMRLGRREPLDREAVSFLAGWVAARPPSAGVTAFAAAAAKELWLEDGAESPGPAASVERDLVLPPRERFVELWRNTVGGFPVDGGRERVEAIERRMRRRGAYAVPMARVHGRLWFAHDRLDAIDRELDRLGWHGAAGPQRAEGAHELPASPAADRAASGNGRPPGVGGVDQAPVPAAAGRLERRPLDFYFSYRSPYSYLAAPRAFALADRFAVDVRFHGVVPMAMRGQSVPQAKRLHTIRDAGREAEALGMPFGPVWDPIGEGARRCLAVGVLATDRGREREWVLTVSRAIWAEAADVTDDEVLRAICESVGLDWRECVAAMADPAVAARVEADTDRLVAMGQWGVPVFVFEDEVHWGQDRIVDVEAALVAAGLGPA